MSGSTPPSPTHATAAQPRHALRIFLVWLVLSAIATPLVYLVLGPHLPPGGMSDSAASQQFDMKVLTAIATPVVLFIWTYFGYALIFFRSQRGVIEDGPPIRGNRVFQAGWLGITTALVLFLFGFGTYELIHPAGAGAGEGPNPIWSPVSSSSTKPLEVQVIAQQWQFTYRYLNAGGFETTQLYLPVDRPVVFHVTSLDVIHGFWAYQLGVKADANPGVDNVAFTTPTQLGRFEVRCSELCGIWHGAMYNNGYVVSAGAFSQWLTKEQQRHAPDLPLLPPAAPYYNPGAGGGFYGSGQEPNATATPSPFPSSVTSPAGS
ncbi:MAG: cytochrome c oxidase subunit II [Actinomycetes bacterium]